MTLLEAVSSCLTKYATFSGRARRAEYWKSVLACYLAFFILAMLYNITSWDIFVYLFLMVAVGSIVPFLAVSVRRLHDIGRPGTWLLLRLVPFVGDLVMFIFNCEDSQPYPNAYGPSPKYPSQQGVMPTGFGLPAWPAAVDQSVLPFHQGRDKAAFEAAAKRPDASGEPALSPENVDEYFDHARETKQAGTPAPRPAPRVSRKLLLLTGACVAVVALIGLAMSSGHGSQGPLPQFLQPVAAPTDVQPAAPTPEETPIYTEPAPAQPASPPAIAAPPETPIYTEPAPVEPPSPPAVAAPPAPAVTLPGDLGLTSPLRPVDCIGQFITIYHSSLVPSAYAEDVQANLDNHPGSSYLLTLGSCLSLSQISNKGTMIYAVYSGPYDTLAQACTAASSFPDETYVKVLDNTTPADQSVAKCP